LPVAGAIGHDWVDTATILRSCPAWWCSSAVAKPLASAPQARWRAGGFAAVIDDAR